MVEKMVKTVGRIAICAIAIFATLLNARVSLELKSDTGQQNQVVIGQPFVLDVIIDDVYGSVGVPTIAGLDGFFAKRTGMYMSSVNGKSTTRYSYQVRIDKLGSFILGPAVVHHQQQEMQSNQIRISVVKDPGIPAQKNQTHTKAEPKTFLRLMVDNESVVVGQKMKCALRFYYQDSSLSLHNIGMPELSGFDCKEIGKLESGTAEIDGVQYHYAQWQWDMYPTKPGEFIIPAYNADYDVPLKDNNHLLSGFFMFVNNRVDRKRIYSNAVTVKVLPLPHYNGEVHAVGLFESICADIKPGIAKEGEGMVLTLEIEGHGNLPAIAVPKLNLPESFKYYDSNNGIIPPRNNDELPKKRFEFIVQGMQPGECEIPEQLFTYFDVEKNNYVTLRTTPLVVSIVPGVLSAKKQDIIASQNVAHDQQLSADEIADINVSGKWYAVEQREALPWWLFQLLLLIPCLYGAYPVIWDKFIFLSGNSVRLTRRRLFKQARKRIAQSIKDGDSEQLYSIFALLVQQLKNVSYTSSLLQTAEWKIFFERITHAAYARTSNEDSQELLEMAKKWLDRLEKNM